MIFDCWPTRALPALLLVGCFNPNVQDEDTDMATDGAMTEATGPGMVTTMPSGGSTDDPGPTTGGEPTTGTTLSTSGVDTIDTMTTLPDPDMGSPGETAECSDHDGCGDNLCIDGVCMPCGDAADPDAACADADASLSMCADDGSLCVACTPDSCGGDTPQCDPQLGCAACTEHSHCPQSACHLGGPLQGSCFDTNDVVEVSDASELADALNATGSGEQRVLWLSSGTFEFSGSIAVSDGAEVAMLGQPDTVLTGGATSLLVHLGGLLYLDRLRFDDGPARGITSNGGTIWLDRVTIVNYGIGMLVRGSAFARRSQFVGGAADGSPGSLVQVAVGASLRAENCGFGPLGDPALDVSGELDLRYATIAGNAAGFSCTSDGSGQIRNSILVNPGSTLSGCDSSNFAWIDNASDSTDVGEQVGSYDASWFVVSNGSRFFLADSALPIFEDIADWDDGDPLTDVEGDPRPTRERGFPGVDEP